MKPTIAHTSRWLAMLLVWIVAPPAIAQQVNLVPLCQYLGVPLNTQSAVLNRSNGDLTCLTAQNIQGYTAGSADVKLYLKLLEDKTALESKVAAIEKQIVPFGGLASKIEEEAKTNKKWRDDALEQNLNAISKVPSRLAEDANLRKVLATMLANDPEFLEELRKALKK